MACQPILPAEWVIAGAGMPYSERYADVYYTAAGGLEQARHVFVAGNHLPDRWRDNQFVILEIGFGLGLNFLATWQSWLEHPGKHLHYVALEKHPFQIADLATLQGEWPELASLAAQLRQRWPLPLPGLHRLHFDTVTLTLGFGDALDLLPQLKLAANAIYLDGFKPQTNPAPWSDAAIAELRRLAASGATLTSWSIAGDLRRRLAGVDFSVEKRPGFGFKRDMLFARLSGPDQILSSHSRRIAVIGAGIAGATVAHALARRGHGVQVFEKAGTPAQGASGNLAGVFRPLPSKDDSRLSRLLRAGFLFGRQQFAELAPRGGWTGVLHIARDAAHEETQRRVAADLPVDYCRYLTREAASEFARWPVERGGWWFAQAGWIDPRSLCHVLLADIACRYDCDVDVLKRMNGGWRIADNEFEIVVLANGIGTSSLVPDFRLPLRAGRGLVSHLPTTGMPVFDIVATRVGYVTPGNDGLRCAGATLQADDLDPTPRLSDHLENLQRLDMILPGYGQALDPQKLDGRVSFRPMSPDRLPLVGPLSASDGLWLINGFGARGLVFAPICAELLASQISGEPLPLEAELVSAITPERFRQKRSTQPRQTR